MMTAALANEVGMVPPLKMSVPIRRTRVRPITVRMTSPRLLSAWQS